MKMLGFMCIMLVGLQAGSYCQDVARHQTQEQNLPLWVRNVFVKRGLDKTLSISYAVNPFYLRGDFNGDEKPDIAVLVERKSTSELGIAVVHSNDSSVYVLGAGNRIGNGGADFDWLDVWSVYPKSIIALGAGETSIPTLRSEALHVAKFGSASGLIYWDGKRYDWYQQGD